MKKASLAVKNGESLGEIVASWEYPENAHDTLCMVERKAQQVARCQVYISSTNVINKILLSRCI